MFRGKVLQFVAWVDHVDHILILSDTHISTLTSFKKEIPFFFGCFLPVMLGNTH